MPLLHCVKLGRFCYGMDFFKEYAISYIASRPKLFEIFLFFSDCIKKKEVKQKNIVSDERFVVEQEYPGGIFSKVAIQYKDLLFTNNELNQVYDKPKLKIKLRIQAWACVPQHIPHLYGGTAASCDAVHEVSIWLSR